MPIAVESRLRDFRELYDREFAFVWAAARRLGVPPAQQEDVVQDVFLTAYRRLDGLRFEVSARAWLHGVTRRIAARYRRTAARRDRRVAAVAAVARGAEASPQDRVLAGLQLERSLARLSTGTRMAFEMAELLGMSAPEIAGELGIPVSTVYSRVRLAREQLERELGGRLAGELGAARAHDAPPPAAAQRAWVVLLPGLTPTSAGITLGGLASARAAVMTTLVLAAGTLALAVGAPPEPTAGGSPPAAPVSVSAAAPAREPVDPPPPPTPPDDPRIAVATPVERGEPAPDRLAAEVALLDRARAELARGALDGAGALLREHGRRFPDGALADLRGATEVELLCRQGAAREAEARATVLVAAHPGSAVAQRFTNYSCPR